MNIIKNNNYHPKVKACSVRCTGFLCAEWNYCNGCFSSFTDDSGNILLTVPLPIQQYDDYKEEDNISEDDNSTEIAKEVIKEMEKLDYIKKEEVFKILKNNYKIDITERTLKYYATEGLIEKSSIGRLPGVTGSVSFYKKNTPGLILLIKYLQNFYRLKLNEIK